MPPILDGAEAAPQDEMVLLEIVPRTHLRVIGLIDEEDSLMKVTSDA